MLQDGLPATDLAVQAIFNASDMLRMRQARLI